MMPIISSPPPTFIPHPRYDFATYCRIFGLSSNQIQLFVRPDPQNQIDPKAVPAWRISGSLSSLFLWIAPVFYGLLALGGSVPNWGILPLTGLVVLNTALQATIIPSIRWRRWRYQIDSHEIYLKYGIFIIRRTLIPVNRIQHVDTRQGPIYRNFGLSSVTITTAATTHEIPALNDEVADEVRNRISNLAREADQDV